LQKWKAGDSRRIGKRSSVRGVAKKSYWPSTWRWRR
jgi:hypothetical protein